MTIVKSGASTDQLTIDATSKAARTTLYKTDGTALATGTLGSNTYIANMMLQNVTVSNNNSSTANIASSASFTGTSESSLGIAAIQINFKSDQAVTIQLQQAQEVPGVNWDTVDSYTVAASTGDARTFQATGSSFRVIVTNNGGSTTTSFRLQTVMCPVVEAVPRALSQLGNFKVSVTEITPSKATYRAATTAPFAAAAATNPFFAIQGSATKTIRIQKIVLSGLSLTTAAYLGINVAKYSTAISSGTATALTITPMDSNDAAGTANLVNVYTGAPTAGNKVGDIVSRRTLAQSSTVSASALPDDDIEFDFRSFGDQKTPILRGTAQGIAVYFNAAPATAVTLSLEVEWTEEN